MSEDKIRQELLSNPKSIDVMFSLIKDLKNQVDVLTQAAKKQGQLNDLGYDVANEVKNEVLMLREKGIVIPHLEKKSAPIMYPRRGKRGLGARPITESEIIDVQKIAKSSLECARKLGVSYRTYKKYAISYGLHKPMQYPPPKGVRPPINPYKGKYPITDIIQNKYPDFPIHRLKDKLIRSGLKEACCEQCGYKERRITDGKIALLLNFEDGNTKNHKIENLKIFCYNCTFTSGKGYIRRGNMKTRDPFDPDIIQGAKKDLNARF